MNRLTVFTPTYNRAYCLDTLYESLIKQTSKEFEWLIIDDGSTDNTSELVDSWINEDKISIRYHYKENGGMHTGHNLAHHLIESELHVCIDSDDHMPVNAVENILMLWSKYGSNKYAGLVGLDCDLDGKVIGDIFPSNLHACTYSDLKNKYHIYGDKKSVYRTEITKKYHKYPTFINEKFVPLYLPILIDRDYPVLCFNEILCVVDYKSDGSTLNIFKQYIKNPIGFAHYRKVLMKYSTYRLEKFTNAVHYISSSILMKNRRFYSESPEKLITIAAIPFGILLHVYVLFKTGFLQNRISGK